MAAGRQGLQQAAAALQQFQRAGPSRYMNLVPPPKAARSFSQSCRCSTTRPVARARRIPYDSAGAASSASSSQDEGQQGGGGPSPSYRDMLRSAISKALWLPLILSITHVGSIGDIHGGSMSPSLNPNEGDRDIVLLNRYSAKEDKLSIGDVILFKSPFDPNLITTKRILAMSGDYVTLHRPAINSSQAKSTPRSTWWPSQAPGEKEEEQHRPEVVARIRIPDHHVWVEGDASVYDEDVRQRMGKHYNMSGAHPRSRDSREFGPIPLGLVIARVDCILWPPSRAGRIPPRPNFDLQRLRDQRAMRTQKGQLGIGIGNDPHPEDSILTPYTHWDPSPNSIYAAEEDEDGGRPRTPRRRRRRGGSEEDNISDEEFDARWRQYLNTVSSGGRLGDHVGRDEI